jgi:hypothetical protein
VMRLSYMLGTEPITMLPSPYLPDKCAKPARCANRRARNCAAACTRCPCSRCFPFQPMQFKGRSHSYAGACPWSSSTAACWACTGSRPPSRRPSGSCGGAAKWAPTPACTRRRWDRRQSSQTSVRPCCLVGCLRPCSRSHHLPFRRLRRRSQCCRLLLAGPRALLMSTACFGATGCDPPVVRWRPRVPAAHHLPQGSAPSDRRPHAGVIHCA